MGKAEKTVNPVIIIPARLAAVRLPDKPLADINGRPMIAHVVDRAREAAIGPVCVATDDVRIAEAADAAGARAVLTRDDHVSGSDRIFEALQIIDPAGVHDVVINLQGDLPTLGPADLRAVFAPLADPSVDIATLAAEITEPEERTDPSVVKVAAFPAGDMPGTQGRRLTALYFSRAAIPAGEGVLYHHIGLYAYRRGSLARFVGLPQGHLEARERLEQLRALEAGMRIDLMLVDTVPLGVDTPADLARARAVLGAQPVGRAQGGSP